MDAKSFNQDKEIWFYGQSNIQNNLFSGYIEQSTQIGCHIRSLTSIYGRTEAPPKNLLALIDADGMSLDELKTAFIHLYDLYESINIAFLNLPDEYLASQLIVWPKVNGIFLEDASQDQLCKGIEVIFSGGFSLPSELIQQCFLDARHKPTSAQISKLLTSREQQIIGLVATGASNIDIAQELNVSMHTVKAHIYNLFRKIEVSNRVQAINWAKQNFSGLLEETE